VEGDGDASCDLIWTDRLADSSPFFGALILAAKQRCRIEGRTQFNNVLSITKTSLLVRHWRHAPLVSAVLVAQNNMTQGTPCKFKHHPVH